MNQALAVLARAACWEQALELLSHMERRQIQVGTEIFAY